LVFKHLFHMNKVLISMVVSCGLFLVGYSQQGGWKNLFNGRNLDGWKQLNGKAKFYVANGAIVGESVMGEPNSFLATEKDFGDYVLEFEFKLENTLNSGVQFRSQSLPEYRDGRVHGYQFEIDPSPRNWTGGIYDEARRDWIYPLDLNPKAKSAYRHGEWNLCRIECIGNTMRTFVNGAEAAHLVDGLTQSGFIALQVHSISNEEDAGKKIMWRNLRIHEGNFNQTPMGKAFVVNTLPNQLSEGEVYNGVHLLWDGKTKQGWRGAYKSGFPEKGWKIEEGILSVMPSDGGESTNGGDIVTQEMYSAFIFQFDFRMSEGANSGVKYFVTENEKNAGSAIGLEYQILDDDKHPDAKQGVVQNRTLASLYDLIPSLREPRARRKIGEWNRGMIVVHPDNRVEHWLNGWKVLEYQRGAPYFYALVARSKYAVWENFGMAQQGRILLQDHGDRVDFRSLKIQLLK
jgi:hypothetical protein